MNVQQQARKRWDSIAKPLHSLGLLEDLVVRIAGTQGTPDVRIDRRCALVFCGDHGVVRKGVSQTGSEVTALVAKSIAEGTGNINLMASSANADVLAVDMGMLTRVPGTIDRHVGSGTADITEGPAMSREQAEKAVAAGIDMMKTLSEQGYRIAVIGEMGIGNTTAASAVTSVLLGLPPEEVTGRGAGLSDAGLRRKIAAIRRAVEVNRPDADDPMDVLAKLGGKMRRLLCVGAHQQLRRPRCLPQPPGGIEPRRQTEAQQGSGIPKSPIPCCPVRSAKSRRTA